MKEYQIAVIGGDGIGPEVAREGVKILQRAAVLDGGFSFAFTELPWGCAYYHQTGRMMPADGLEQLRRFDAIFLGAVGDPSVPDNVSLHGLLLAIRRGFDQYVNLRPIKLLHGAETPLKNVRREDIDMTFIRENSEGEYAGLGGRMYEGQEHEFVTQTGVFSRRGTSRIIRYAYELARAQKKSLTSISKSNALNYSMVYWDELFHEIGREYPDVPTKTLLVDAASMLMVTHPERFEIVVASNLFGDILTDLGAAIAGGIGLAAGANLNPERRFPSMFEPIHGSAPDIAGKGVANPMAAIWSASQILDFFGHQDWGARVLTAMETVLQQKQALTPDMGGSASTAQTGDAVANALGQ